MKQIKANKKVINKQNSFVHNRILDTLQSFKRFRKGLLKKKIDSIY